VMLGLRHDLPGELLFYAFNLGWFKSFSASDRGFFAFLLLM
jgi:hypothetical protein